MSGSNKVSKNKIVTLGFAALLCVVLASAAVLFACSSNEQEDSLKSAAPEIQGEVLEMSSCFVLLPEDWSWLEYSNTLCNDSSEPYQYIKISLSEKEKVEQDIQESVESELNPTHPPHFVGTQGEDIIINDMTFKTIDYDESEYLESFGMAESSPRVGLFGLLGDQILKIELISISADDPVVEAVVRSIIPKE